MKTFKELRKEINESVISEADKNDQFVNDPWLGTKPFWQKAKQKVASVGQMIPGMNKPLKSQKPTTVAKTPSQTGIAAKPQTSSQPTTSSGIEQRRSRAQELKQLGKEKSQQKVAQQTPPTTTKPVPATGIAAKPAQPKSAAPATKPAQPKSAAPATKPAQPKTVAPIQKPAAPTKKILPASSPAMDDLRASAARMKSATSDMTSKTGALKSTLTPKPSFDTKSAIQKLGGEPAKPVSAAPKTSSITPPRLSSSELKKNPSAGGGKWM